MKTLSLVLVSLLSVSASADVTIKQKAKNSGYKGMGAFESEGARMISGVKARDEGTMKFTGAIMGRLSGKKGSVEIQRVDLDKIWRLDTKKKTYTESSITPQKGEKDEESPERAEESKRKEEKPTHRVKKTSFEVKKTSDKKEINGFPTQLYKVTLAMEVEELASKEVTTYKMVSDQWTTPWTKTLRQAVDEENKFTQAYLKKLGVEMSLKERGAFGMTALQMMTGAGDAELKKTMGDFKKQVAKLEGYPIRTETKWLTELDPKAKKRAEAAKKERAKADDDDSGVDLDGGIGGVLGGFAKKAASKKAKKMAEERATAQEGKPAFEGWTEVESVSTDSLDDGLFEVPEGYKKKD